MCLNLSFNKKSKKPFKNAIMNRTLMVWLAVLCMGFNLNQVAQANSHGDFKELANLETLAETSNQTGLPILLMFGATWCEYCEELIDQVFEPIVRGGNYDGKVVLLRHVGVDEQALIPGFDGKLLKKSEWAYQLNADLTPTVLFLDGSGKEVAPRIVGITNTHLYAGLIHERLNVAYQNMNNPFRIPITPDLYEQQLQQQNN